MASLDRILADRSDIWKGPARPPRAVLPSGYPVLDRELPGGGWPRGQLVELLARDAGIGEVGLFLPALSRLTAGALPVVLAGPPLLPCPQAWLQAGVGLEHLLVLDSESDSLWAAEQCLKSGLCGAVLAWPARGRVNARTIRRLQLAAEGGDALAVVCYRPGQQPPSSTAGLRLVVHPGQEITLLRARGRGGEHRLKLGADNLVVAQTSSGSHAARWPNCDPR